jgi:hypothetical protein
MLPAAAGEAGVGSGLGGGGCRFVVALLPAREDCAADGKETNARAMMLMKKMIAAFICWNPRYPGRSKALRRVGNPA